MKKTICNNKAFTIIELILVIFIIFIFSGIIINSTKYFEKRNLQYSALELQSNIRYIQRLSILENNQNSIIFDIANNRYLLIKAEKDSTNIYKSVSFKNGVTLYETNAINNTLDFTSRGTPNRACTITLKSKKFILPLTVNVGSGRVLIKDIIEL